jgi:NADPH-ferrihemoprotein reductase
MESEVVDLEDFTEATFVKTALVVLCAATHGEGDPTDNSVKFHKWVNKNKKEGNSELMKGVRFTVFGLGNTQYENYNEMGRIFDKGFEAIGGERAFEYGEGDDDKCLEDDFRAWKKRLWKGLADFYGSRNTEPTPTARESIGRKMSLSKKKGLGHPYKLREIPNEETVDTTGQEFDMTSRKYVQEKTSKDFILMK